MKLESMKLAEIKQSLLALSGAHNRQSFVVGLVIFTLFFLGQKWIMTESLLQTMPGFLLSLVFFGLNCWMILALFGKRLRDMGKRLWWFTGMITAELCVVIATMLAFGGAEYFSAFAQYQRKEDIPEERRLEIINTYQATLEAHNTETLILFWIVPCLFILWLALTPSIRKN